MKPTTASVVPLAQRWACGDRIAGNDLISAHDDWIVGFAKRRSPSGEDWQDAAQVARLGFLRACRTIKDGPDSHTVSSLTSRMRDHLWDERRGRERAPEISEDVDPDEHVSDVDLERSADAHILMERAKLTDRQRLCMVGVAFGMLPSEIAEALGCHRTLVCRDIERGIHELRSVAGISVVVEPAANETPMRRVESLLRIAGPMTGPAIREALGTSEFVTWKALKDLAKAGAVSSEGAANRRTYSLTRAGVSGVA